MQIDARQLIASLRSTTCPACGQAKRAAQSVCGTCWRNLPAGIRNRLYRRVGDGYEQAFLDAMASLKVQRIHPPGDAAPVSASPARPMRMSGAAYRALAFGEDTP